MEVDEWHQRLDALHIPSGNLEVRLTAALDRLERLLPDDDAEAVPVLGSAGRPAAEPPEPEVEVEETAVVTTPDTHAPQGPWFSG